jgi:hypothetical protein
LEIDESHFMRLKILINISVSVFFLFSILSCEKKTEIFVSEKITDYLPLTIGKYITYRLDSTVFTNVGRNEEIHSYQVKHVVDAQIPDNLGRPSFRIFRYLRDSAGTLPWIPDGAYYVTPLTDQAELVEDNLRFIKLHIPFKINVAWKGNKYINADPYAFFYTFSNDDNMNDWDYKYDQFEQSTVIGGQAVKDVYTVSQIDEAINAPVTDSRAYGARTFSVEKYARNIGLVSRDYVLWEYQPNTGGSGGGYKTGFGVKMRMIDHN